MPIYNPNIPLSDQDVLLDMNTLAVIGAETTFKNKNGHVTFTDLYTAGVNIIKRVFRDKHPDSNASLQDFYSRMLLQSNIGGLIWYCGLPKMFRKWSLSMILRDWTDCLLEQNRMFAMSSNEGMFLQTLLFCNTDDGEEEEVLSSLNPIWGIVCGLFQSLTIWLHYFYMSTYLKHHLKHKLNTSLIKSFLLYMYKELDIKKTKQTQNLSLLIQRVSASRDKIDDVLVYDITNACLEKQMMSAQLCSLKCGELQQYHEGWKRGIEVAKFILSKIMKVKKLEDYLPDMFESAMRQGAWFLVEAMLQLYIHSHKSMLVNAFTSYTGSSEKWNSELGYPTHETDILLMMLAPHFQHLWSNAKYKHLNALFAPYSQAKVNTQREAIEVFCLPDYDNTNWSIWQLLRYYNFGEELTAPWVPLCPPSLKAELELKFKQQNQLIMFVLDEKYVYMFKIDETNGDIVKDVVDLEEFADKKNNTKLLGDISKSPDLDFFDRVPGKTKKENKLNFHATYFNSRMYSNTSEDDNIARDIDADKMFWILLHALISKPDRNNLEYETFTDAFPCIIENASF